MHGERIEPIGAHQRNKACGDEQEERNLEIALDDGGDIARTLRLRSFHQARGVEGIGHADIISDYGVFCNTAFVRKGSSKSVLSPAFLPETG